MIIRNEREDVAEETKHIERMIKQYGEQLRARKCGALRGTGRTARTRPGRNGYPREARIH